MFSPRARASAAAVSPSPSPPHKIVLGGVGGQACVGLPGLPESVDLIERMDESISEEGRVRQVRYSPHQKLMRHASATTTLNTYAGLWPTDDAVARDVLSELYREQPEVEGVVDLRRAEVS